MCEIEVRNLSYSYSGSLRKALDSISFSVCKGEFVGVIGPNGSGKTTLVKSLTSILPYKGNVKIMGKEVKHRSKMEFARLVGVVAQEFLPAYDMRAREIVEMGRIPHTGLLGQLSKEDVKHVDEAFEYLEISHLKDRMFYSMSGGERQMVYVAKVFAQEPQVLLLDEATSHLDIGHVEILLKKIKSIFKRQNRTVVATFHDINQASTFSDRIMVMKNGKLIKDGPPEILTEKLIYEVYGAHCTIIRHPKTNKINVLMDLEGERSSDSQRSTLIQSASS